MSCFSGGGMRHADKARDAAAFLPSVQFTWVHGTQGADFVFHVYAALQVRRVEKKHLPQTDSLDSADDS
jgi:hypothetical protein